MPSLVMMDAISRLVPGVLGNDDSAVVRVFRRILCWSIRNTAVRLSGGKRKCRRVLLSGHHANVEAWRREQSVIRTAKWRPDLLEHAELTQKERQIVKKILAF